MKLNCLDDHFSVFVLTYNNQTCSILFCLFRNMNIVDPMAIDIYNIGDMTRAKDGHQLRLHICHR